MKQLFQSLNEILNKTTRTRKLVTVLMVLVVFVTTYILILPAFTLTQEKAEQQGGIDVPAVEQTADTEEADEHSDVDVKAEETSDAPAQKAPAEVSKETKSEKDAEEPKQE